MIRQDMNQQNNQQENPKTYSIYEVLERIEQRPAMYTGENTLSSIRSYLSGYRSAMMDMGIEDDSIPEFGNFHEFVRSHFNYYESTAGWMNMILAVAIGLKPESICWTGYDSNVTTEQHKEAIKLFYKLLKEFRTRDVHKLS